VDYKNVNLLASQKPPQYYSEILTRGKDQLRYLRENPDEKRNVKDLKYEEEEKLEIERKKKADAEERKEKERQLKNKQIEANKDYKASFGAEVGLAGAVILAGGIGIASMTTSRSDEDYNATQAKGLANDLGTQTSIQQSNDNVDSEKPIVSDASIDTAAFEEDTIAKFFADEMDPVPSGSIELLDDQTFEAPSQSDLDYEDSWLGAIADILNEDEDDIHQTDDAS
jgi:hypothetical protein